MSRLFDPIKLESYPTAPGVYLMKNAGGTVLYVGKAKNLKIRLKQYFSSGGDGRAQIPYLIARVAAIETIVVHSESEALLLENNLIKQHRPRYNALLKDDKTYIALKVDLKEKWPRLEIFRYKEALEKKKNKPQERIFGPYTSGYSARATFDLLHSLFPLRQCSDREFASRKRPCILYDMKRCLGPCVQKCTEEEYRLAVDRTLQFLKGQDREVQREIKKKMEEAAEALDFEKAAELLKQLQQIEKTITFQSVDRPYGGDSDVIGLYRLDLEANLCFLEVRGGRLLSTRHYKFSDSLEDDGELIQSFIMQHYMGLSNLPYEVLTPIELPDTQALMQILAEKRGGVVDIFVPQRGEKVKLLDMARLNAEAAYRNDRDEGAKTEAMLLEMQELFKLQNLPRRIDCFDISNLSGTDPVASMVVFIDGKSKNSEYRKYKIKTTEGEPNDYAAMKEVLTRRFERGKKEGNLPDLLIVDGGKGHLNIAIKVLAELNVISCDLIALAKEEGRHDKGLSVEQVFLPNLKDPILLKKRSSILFLFQKIRDEAHRVAISFHRQRRSKRTFKSALDEIAGIGPVKKQAILKHFGSVKQMVEAGFEKLSGVKGLNQKDLQALKPLFE